jgi:hypothetical protein
MATTFLEPGGDADFALATTNGFWDFQFQFQVATDFVHGNHVKSLKSPANTITGLRTKVGSLADTGSRVSFYIYFTALPAVSRNFAGVFQSGGTPIVYVYLTTGGVLQLRNSAGTQIGSSGSTLSTGVWYRISLAYTITSTTVNRFELFLNGSTNVSVTNTTLTNVTSSLFSFVNENAPQDTTMDYRISDIYIDDSSSLTDTGDIWVTAKRPNADGSLNNFSTQIGSGGSGYGSGHSPQVNERALSTTNGWSAVVVGSAVTEEYNIESKSQGDIDISTATIIDYLGWVSAKALTSETAQIVVDGASTNVSLTTTITLFTKIKGSTSYPAGTGADIGLTTSTTVTTVSLHECGVIVAYTPGTPPVANAISNSSAGAYMRRQVTINGY